MYSGSNRTFVGPGNGITGGNYDVYASKLFLVRTMVLIAATLQGADRRIPRSMTAFTAISWYNAIEIVILLFFVFKRYSDLYFWSLLVASLSLVSYATGAWMKQNNVSHNEVMTESLLTIGWILLIPASSMVLYSRLHLISQHHKLLRFIFWIIVVDAIVLCIPTVVLSWTSKSAHLGHSIRGYSVIEKIQMTLFTVQELFISAVYLWEVRRILRVIFTGSIRNVMWQLVMMNVLIIILDTALLTVEFLDLYMIEITLKSLVYSVKLKAEFAVLSKMISVITSQNNTNKVVSRAVARRLPNVDIEKLASSGLGSAVQGSIGKHDDEWSVHDVQDNSRELRGLQQNLPPNWRLSIGHESPIEPDLLEIQRNQAAAAATAPSLSSTENLYPGRLA